MLMVEDGWEHLLTSTGGNERVNLTRPALRPRAVGPNATGRDLPCSVRG
ncbi:predicted protein [Streptomyces filamentosus NRRL 15998]|uniref:Predicted protein n=1 Tax=Streptomyces filamentosus NRRL 15998 TaxID=457431 RepID=D6AIH2_STRFL|nr:predicted protein [Streptomyces filamentosus NRRL 15998]